MAEGHFLDRFRVNIIQQVSNVDPAMDKLLEKRLLTLEQYELVISQSTSPAKMRKLYDHMKGWGDMDKDTVCHALRENNPKITIFEKWRPSSSIKSSGAGNSGPACEQDLGKLSTANKYGDISEVECSGASQATARLNGLQNAGVQTSHLIAEQDVKRMEPYKAIIQRVAGHRNLHPALIAAIISRESRFGKCLRDGWSLDRQCFGLMQVAKRYHNIVGEYNSEEHIDQAAGILVDIICVIRKKFPEWKMSWQLKGGVAAYNCGASRVMDYDNLDKATVLQDYANDVLARAQWFKQHCF